MTRPPRANKGAADRPPGGAPCNTPPQTSHHGVNTPLPMAGGEDWLEWCWYIQWSEHRWPALRDMLENAKRIAAMKPEDRGDRTGDMIQLGDRDALVSPAGGRLGDRRKGPYMAYAFTWQGLDFLLADRRDPQKRNPSMVVRATGLACLERGAHECYELARELLLFLAGTVTDEKLSRVDLCLDLPGQTIAPFKAAFDDERYITRAKSYGFDKSNGITIRFGSSSVLLRIYDKLAEVTKSQDGYKRSLMAFHRWSGIEPDAATRVEFELLRNALKDRGVNSVADYYDRRGDLIQYLCDEWIRFTTTKPDRTHTTRAETLALWQQVKDGFIQWTGMPRGIKLDPLPREGIDVRSLVRGAIGTLLTAAVKQGQQFEDDQDVLRYFLAELKRELCDVPWADNMRKKAVMFADE